jgi:hypothetical protein
MPLKIRSAHSSVNRGEGKKYLIFSKKKRHILHAKTESFMTRDKKNIFCFLPLQSVVGCHEELGKRLGAVGRGLGCRCGAGKFSRRNRPQVAPR